MAAMVTRTINRLPFQDLEAKRFEDLVRQLTYDFRPWRRLEATGRSGGDQGFDARALEIVDLAGLSVQISPDDPDDAEETAPSQADRLWLIQCKREREIGPSQAASYLSQIEPTCKEGLHGLIFAAACDFSKKTRDTIYGWCRKQGIAEVYVWGRGELEDMLFQPKNDSLLFAYFGISLSIRRRALATDLRAEIAIKKKIRRTILTSSAGILVRDPTATEYPEAPPNQRPTRWLVVRAEQLTFLGLMVSTAWHYAYVDLESGEWDAADQVIAMEHDNPWTVQDKKKTAKDEAARRIWDSLPDGQRGWLKVSRFIPFRNIIAIDESGDDVFDGVHLYAVFQSTDGPFEGLWPRVVTASVIEQKIEPLAEK